MVQSCHLLGDVTYLITNLQVSVPSVITAQRTEVRTEVCLHETQQHQHHSSWHFVSPSADVPTQTRVTLFKAKGKYCLRWREKSFILHENRSLSAVWKTYGKLSIKCQHFFPHFSCQLLGFIRCEIKGNALRLPISCNLIFWGCVKYLQNYNWFQPTILSHNALMLWTHTE
jgi:hypothetical protein